MVDKQPEKHCNNFKGTVLIDEQNFDELTTIRQNFAPPKNYMLAYSIAIPA